MDVMHYNKVKLIAVAKDEGAYLAEWIHHHLYFGFHEIEIVLNRTKDCSKEMLTKIKQAYPMVKWRYADFVDLIPGSVHKKLQHIAYGMVLSDDMNSTDASFSHFMFLDIDEFWVPVDEKSTISTFIENAGRVEAIAFNWLNDVPSTQPFTKIQPVFTGNSSDVVKSLVPLSRSLKAIRIHKPLLKPDSYLLADGKPFIASQHNEEHSARSTYSGAFVYHRFYRSEIEYVSNLYRGNPEGNDVPYKTNRSGLPFKASATHEISFPGSDYENYATSFKKFVEACNLKPLIDVANEFVLQRYENAVASLPKNLPVYHSQILRLFKNVSEPRIVRAIVEYHDRLVDGYGKSVEPIRDLAIKVESYSIAEARRIMLKALALRPEGPRINAKINEYNQKVD
ncbi:glycosyltransferase family 2 protein [Alteromonas sp. 1_MG-2023]|uniref:glycosyltransferase family 2 protein n=1 Tax=Alteromonas sp. 1_MG-2023 TaxID=3062669 RepID=UPI0026E173BC|nr:glycosyltransferase family 2 protein [Alteromonas sp. 1_MG-2023]MDO6477521.1 glycosyltransferase family 2 protein [Alteromonas sp. 1_MG-2023]